MRKNQKYSQEEMYKGIEKWQSSGLTQLQFCKQENLAKATFRYWLIKYRKDKGVYHRSLEKPVKTFIPIDLPEPTESPALNIGPIEITYPNGVKLSCSASIEVQQLITLISL